MSTHVVTLPDGRKVKVQAPADADEEAILSFALHTLILGETKAREKQDQEIEKWRADVREVLAEFREISSRLDRIESWVSRKQDEKAPVMQAAPAPVVKINPEVKVISDPSVAKAIAESRQGAQDNAEMIRDALSKITVAPSKADQQPAPSPVEWIFDVQHETDTHSPRFGRMKRVIARPQK